MRSLTTDMSGRPRTWMSGLRLVRITPSEWLPLSKHFLDASSKGLLPISSSSANRSPVVGVRPNLIEILTKIDGCDFLPAYSNRIVGKLDDLRRPQNKQKSQ